MTSSESKSLPEWLEVVDHIALPRDELVAKELWVKRFRDKSWEYERIGNILEELWKELLTSSVIWMTSEDFITYLFHHRENVFRIFDTFPWWSYRFPALFHRGHLAQLSAQIWYPEETISHYVSLCIDFFLYLNWRRVIATSMWWRKWRISEKEAAQARIDAELRVVWCNIWSVNSGTLWDERMSIILSELLWDESVIQISIGSNRLFAESMRDLLLRGNLWHDRIFLDMNEMLLVKVWDDMVLTRLPESDSKSIIQRNLESLEFYLCQNHLAGFDDIFGVLRWESHWPVWCAFIKKHIRLLVDNNSETAKVFRRVFWIGGNIFDVYDGQYILSTDSVGALITHSMLESQEHFSFTAVPPILDALQEHARRIPVKVDTTVVQHAHETWGRVNDVILWKSEEPVDVWAEDHTRIEVLHPKKKEIPKPSKDVFVHWGEKGQMSQINLTGLEVPEGTIVRLERGVSVNKKMRFTQLECNIWSKNDIDPMKDFSRWHIIYRLTFEIPEESVFVFEWWSRTCVLEERVYVDLQMPFTTQSVAVSLPAWVPVRASSVASINGPVQAHVQAVLTSRNPWDIAREIWWILLSDDAHVESNIDSSDCILFTLPKEWQNEVAPDFHSICVTFWDPIVCVPSLWDDIDTILIGRATWIRQERQQQTELLAQQECEQKEYEEIRRNFEPLLNFARDFQFEGREIGDIKQQKDRLRWELAPYGWSIPTKMAVGAQWRHKDENITIHYSTTACDDYRVAHDDWQTLTRAQQRCYGEVAESCAHIARFFTAETNVERKAIVQQERKFNKEIEDRVVTFENQLREWNARLVQFSRRDLRRFSRSSKFPEGETPTMLSDRAWYETIDQLILDNPGAELCYRRDTVRINGEIPHDASSVSFENTMMNLQELRNSPRARYILRKRILITLKLEKFTGDDDRSPITEEENLRTWWVTALSLLLELNGTRNPQSWDNVDDAFMDAYIDLLENHRIRIQYVWPLSVTLENHKKRVAKLAK
jgi:hypothetical protein